MATTTVALPEPLALEAVGGDTPRQYHAADLRQFIGASFPRYGRLGPGDAFWLYPRQAGANWSLDVQAGWALIAPPTNPAYAAERYLVTLPTRTNLSLAAFNLAPTVTRTHAVWIVLKDKGVSGTAYGADLVVTEDVGAGAPTPTGTNAAKIGTVTISPSQANISTTHLAMTLGRSGGGQFPVVATLLNGMLGGDGNAGSTALQYSVDGNSVRFTGSVKTVNPYTMTAGNSYIVANVGVGYRPAYARGGMIVGSNATLARVIVGTDGDVTLTPYAGNATAMTSATFDGFGYEIY